MSYTPIGVEFICENCKTVQRVRLRRGVKIKETLCIKCYRRKLHRKSDWDYLHPLIPFDTENRPSILDECARCGHLFKDHNLSCSKCDCEGFMVYSFRIKEDGKK